MKWQVQILLSYKETEVTQSMYNSLVRALEEPGAGGSKLRATLHYLADNVGHRAALALALPRLRQGRKKMLKML